MYKTKLNFTESSFSKSRQSAGQMNYLFYKTEDFAVFTEVNSFQAVARRLNLTYILHLL